MKFTSKSVLLFVALVVLSNTAEGAKLRGAKSTRGLSSDKSRNYGGGPTEYNGYTAPSGAKWTFRTCPPGQTLFKYFPNNPNDYTYYCDREEQPLSPNAQPGDGTNRAPPNLPNLPNTVPQYVPSTTQTTTAKINVVVNGQTQKTGTIPVVRGNGNE